MFPQPYKAEARIAGVLFLVAMVSSLAGGALIQSVLDKPGYFSQLADGAWPVHIGIALEIVNALAVVGIIAALWAPLAHHSVGGAAAYFGVRLLEAGACAAAALIPIAQLGLIRNGPAAASDAELLNTLRNTLVSYAVPIFFGVGAVVLYTMLYRSVLVPRYIAVWGLIGAVGVLANVLIPVLDLRWLVLPIIGNEVYLGIFLIARGLSSSSSTRPAS